MAVGSRGVVSGHARRLGFLCHLCLVLKCVASVAVAAAANTAGSLPRSCAIFALGGIGRSADIGGCRVSAVERGLCHADGIVSGGRCLGGRAGSFSFCDSRQGRFYGGTSR